MGSLFSTRNTQAPADFVEKENYVEKNNKKSKFRFGQYNILAACLAENLKPWFWYGYNGRPVGDDLDFLRLEIFGSGRSRVLSSFFITLKSFVKVYNHSSYGYELGKRSTFTGGVEKNIDLHNLMANYICQCLIDFFHRNNLTSPEGDYDLVYHLIFNDSKSFKNWQEITTALDIHFSEENLEKLQKFYDEKLNIEQNGDKKAILIDEFNAMARRFITRCSDEEEIENIESIFVDKMKLLARFISLANKDLELMLKVDESWDWAHRGEQIKNEMLKHDCQIWNVEELDKIEDMKNQLSPKLKLAAFKTRKVHGKEDGAAIFYDPNLFKIKVDEEEEQLNIGYIRFSAESTLLESGNLQALTLNKSFINDGIIKFEESEVNEGDEIPFWGYSAEGYEMSAKQSFDERIAIFVAFEHLTTNHTIVVICTHLYHTQNDEFHEQLRAIQLKQIEEGLEMFLKYFNLNQNKISIIIGGDFNDVRELNIYKNRKGPSEMYTELQRQGWEDIFLNQAKINTSVTMSRKVNIDYLAYKSNVLKAKGMSIIEPQLLDENGEPLPIGETKDAVFGTPSCIGSLIQPSDHCVVVAEFN